MTLYNGKTVGWRVVRRTKRRRWYISSKEGELWTENPDQALVYKNRDDANHVAWVQHTLGIRTSTERVRDPTSRSEQSTYRGPHH